MADHNGPYDILIMKGTFQVMTDCIQRMHLSITRIETLEKVVLQAAMSNDRLNVDLENEKKGQRAVKREVFWLNKVDVAAKKSRVTAIETQTKLEGMVVELEAIIAIMVAEQTTWRLSVSNRAGMKLVRLVKRKNLFFTTSSS
ncbi:uncharacterized protein LOC114305771 isoform X2 [Camellia sinensis]|nr:uncharacterized protein LOC114305771 isoform X2 [Camellia sinensis]